MMRTVAPFVQWTYTVPNAWQTLHLFSNHWNKSRPPCFTDQESDLQKYEGSQLVAGWDEIPSLTDSQILNPTWSFHLEATLSHIADRCDRLD